MSYNVSTTVHNDTVTAPTDCFVLQLQDFIPWDNTDSVVSAETEDLVRRLKDVVFLPILFLIGLPANVINMAVFYKQGLRERINVCLFALSLSDGLYLVHNIVLYGEQLHIQFTTRERYGPIMQFMTNHNLVGFYGFTWVSQVLSAIIASERCFCILQPLRSTTLLRTSTTAAIIVVVFVLVVGLYSLVVTRFHIVCAYDPVTDHTVMTGIPSEFYWHHKKLIDYLDSFFFGIGLPGVVMVVVVTTTAITAVKLREAAAWRAETSSARAAAMSSRELAVTRMLVGNSIFFIICVFPIALFRYILLAVPELNAGRRHHNMFWMSFWILDVIAYVNATFNFVIYYVMGSRYRETVWQLFGRKNTDSKTTTEGCKSSSALK